MSGILSPDVNEFCTLVFILIVIVMTMHHTQTQTHTHTHTHAHTISDLASSKLSSKLENHQYTFFFYKNQVYKNIKSLQN